MLSARVWNPSAIIRLILCLIACLFCGSLLMAVLHAPGTGRADDLRFYRLTASALGFTATALVFVYRPWDYESVVGRLIGYLVCIYGGFFLGFLAQKNTKPLGPSVSQMVVAGLSLQGAALVLIAHFLREQKLGWRESFGLANRRRDAVMKGILLACLFLPLARLLQWISAEVMIHVPYFQMKPQVQESVQTLQMAESWGSRVVLAVITILLAPLAEEMLFRGILYPAIKQAGLPRLAFWGCSLLFALIHFNLVTFVPLLALAICLTVLYEKTDNLLAPITAHACFNCMNFVMLYVSYPPLGLGK
jgi:membrane protease YdiL (CAAX protease family)